MITPVCRSTRTRPPAQAEQLPRAQKCEPGEPYPHGDAGTLAQEEGACRAPNHDPVDGQRAVWQLLAHPRVHEPQGGPLLAAQAWHAVVQRGQEVRAAAPRLTLIVAALDEGARQFVECALPIRDAFWEVLAKCDEGKDLAPVAALCAWGQPQVRKPSSSRPLLRPLLLGSSDYAQCLDGP